MSTRTHPGAPTHPDATSNAVERLVARLRIDLRMHTEPELLADILRTDMRLHDLTRFTARLGAKLTQPQPMQPFLEEIAAGINRQQPALRILIGEALDAGLIPIPDDNGLRKIIRSLHHTYLLDELTRAMVSDVGFNNAVGEHLLAKREEIGVRRTFFGSMWDIFRVTERIFSPAKAKTMDYVFYNLYRRLRQITPGVITSRKTGEKNFWLLLNIFEAVLTDATRKESNNAMAGVALMLSPITHLRVRPQDKFIHNYVPEGWPALYQTWNMAFVLGNLNNPHLLLPKLLIPCLINSAPEDYLYIRGVSLWTTINFQLFARHAGTSDSIANNEAIATLWGAVNRRYAQRFIDQEFATAGPRWNCV